MIYSASLRVSARSGTTYRYNAQSHRYSAKLVGAMVGAGLCRCMSAAARAAGVWRLGVVHVIFTWTRAGAHNKSCGARGEAHPDTHRTGYDAKDRQDTARYTTCTCTHMHMHMYMHMSCTCATCACLLLLYVVLQYVVVVHVRSRRSYPPLARMDGYRQDLLSPLPTHSLECPGVHQQ